MLNCYDVAKYFIAQIDEDAGDLVSNLKLQKLVYYAQGINLALSDQPLFPEALEAWIHGPVVPVLFHTYKRAGAIPPPGDMDFSIYCVQTREVLDEVYTVFGQFSAWKLYQMTHEEPPWKNTPVGHEISFEAMRDYFKTQVVT
ncbi:phage-associated protein [Candidatus Thiomargarita nelsonii]|uniref:Phage-associated protein n=1 Tax=Candidatus Thiomargarita nelsonii TaxID=1003181 RepID=A0A4E0QR02_9GAMM|nr:phage-associated protein [Candidatus Thiomargarita nelsonii]